MLFGDNKDYQVLGSYTIIIKMFDGYYKDLHNVRYVLELKRKLISIRTLDSNNCVMKIDKRIVKVIRGAITLMKGEIRNGLYVLDG